MEICPGRWVGEGYPTFVIAEIGQFDLQKIPIIA
jgi:hypothetical protein